MLDCTYRTPGGRRFRPRCRSQSTVNRALKVVAAIYLVGLIVAVMAYKAAFIGLMFSNLFFGVYSVCVASYILSRFLFSLFYRSQPVRRARARDRDRDAGLQRGGRDRQSLRSLLAVDYPQEKLELIAVNDGSTDSHARRRCRRSRPNRTGGCA